MCKIGLGRIMACLVVIWLAGAGCSGGKSPVDYVNPYMGNISHLLVPAYPTVHLPNSMLRVYPERADYTSDRVKGLPLVVTSHRGSSAFNLSPWQGDGAQLKPVIDFTYDHEKITPYSYEVVLDEQQTAVEYAVSSQSAIYGITFSGDGPAFLVFNSRNGAISVDGNKIEGYQQLANNTRVYLYAEVDRTPVRAGVLSPGRGIDASSAAASGANSAVAMEFDGGGKVMLRYGISFIDEAQARDNLHREIENFDLAAVARKGRDCWNKALGSIEVQGGSEDERTVFYTSLYRYFERPVCISEAGRYFSAFDGKVHNDEGTPFYTDDWIWDTYRAAHPLRILIDAQTESDVITSYVRMAGQMGTMWMPTFPEITGDSRRMNSNHAVATVADAWAKGLRSFDLDKAYEACRKGIEDKTLAPWSGAPAGWLDEFYKANGYIPALAPGEVESVPEVNSFEKRQPVAVTLGTAYDQWCLSRIAGFLDKPQDEAFYAGKSLNYRNIYNSETGFFHPKDKDGNFIMPFSYNYSGGQGAREYYGENNAWVYRWDVQHNIPDLISLMGGSEKFCANLDQMFREPLGKSKFEFYAHLPDHTGNVGQFSMANEPSLHIPYLYNYAGQPWKTQKKIHTLLGEWFRNDLMGLPGDEDGGGMSAFVVFSQIGFYPVTPGSTEYTIGSPAFASVSINLSNGKVFEVVAKNSGADNKYIQSATINGRRLDVPFIDHSDIAGGGKLVLEMGDKPNYEWGTGR